MVFVLAWSNSLSAHLQSQQPLEDLDAQLRRALSPETVPVGGQASHISVASVGQPGMFDYTQILMLYFCICVISKVSIVCSSVPFPVEEETLSSPVHPPQTQLGRFKVKDLQHETPHMNTVCM